MIFKMINSFPNDVDTVVNFVNLDSKPKFNSETIKQSFETAFGDDILKTKSGNIQVLRMKNDKSYVNMIFATVVSDKEYLLDSFRKIILKIGSKLNELESKTVYFDNIESVSIGYDEEELLRQIASTLPMCDYTFNKYKLDKKKITEKNIYVYGDEKYAQALNEGANIAEGVCIARDLVNEPANILTPLELANRTVEFGKKYGFDVEVYDKKQIKEIGMKALLEVSSASPNEPKLIVMKYNGGGNEIAKGIIGKGLCYDSGGLFLKKGEGMKDMKGDMAGAAAVIGAMCSIAKNKLKKNVITVVAACENLVDGNGYKNGDIIHTMSGKTVFIASTDAEGRLTLADAMTYMISKQNVDSILELSTLTGSCATFFGNVCCGVLTTNDNLYNKIYAKSQITGEKYWRIPTYPEYKENIKSDIADLYNSTNSGAGGIAAGMFLTEFSENKPFMHMDIAGVTFTHSSSDGQPKGATGYGVKTVYNYIKE